MEYSPCFRCVTFFRVAGKRLNQFGKLAVVRTLYQLILRCIERLKSSRNVIRRCALVCKNRLCVCKRICKCGPAVRRVVGLNVTGDLVNQRLQRCLINLVAARIFCRNAHHAPLVNTGGRPLIGGIALCYIQAEVTADDRLRKCIRGTILLIVRVRGNRNPVVIIRQEGLIRKLFSCRVFNLQDLQRKVAGVAAGTIRGNACVRHIPLGHRIVRANVNDHL